MQKNCTYNFHTLPHCLLPLTHKNTHNNLKKPYIPVALQKEIKKKRAVNYWVCPLMKYPFLSSL